MFHDTVIKKTLAFNKRFALLIFFIFISDMIISKYIFIVCIIPNRFCYYRDYAERLQYNTCYYNFHLMIAKYTKITVSAKTNYHLNKNQNPHK